jgi:hypothetical protein
MVVSQPWRLVSWTGESKRSTFLDERGRGNGAGADAFHVLGSVKHDLQTIAEQVGGGLEARDEEQRHVVQQFRVSEPAVGLIADRQQVAEQVAAGIGTSLGSQVGEIREQLDCRGIDARQGFEVVHLKDPGQVPGQRPETRAINVWYPDQLADHRHGQEVSEILHELDGGPVGAAVGHRVKQVVRHRLDRRTHAHDAPGGESLREQAPDPRVPRGVEVQDPVHALEEDRIVPPCGNAFVQSGLIGDQEARVTQDQVDVVIPDDEHVVLTELDDLAKLVQCRIERIRIGSALRRSECGQDLRRIHDSRIHDNGR